MSPSIYDLFNLDASAAADSLSVMLEQERKTYFSSDYFEFHCDKRRSLSYYDSDFVTMQDRKKMVDWCFSVVDHCQLSRENVSIAMEILDRYLSIRHENGFVSKYLSDHKEYQLAAMSSLYTAIKLNEYVSFDSSSFAAMSCNSYSKKDIEDKEREILDCIQWRLAAPTSLQISYQILSLVKPHTNFDDFLWGKILNEVRFNTENAVRDYYFTTQRLSTAAMASIFSAIEILGDEEDRRSFVNALVYHVIKDFRFSSSKTLLSAKRRLNQFIEKETGVDHEQEDFPGERKKSSKKKKSRRDMRSVASFSDLSQSSVSQSSIGHL